MDEPRLDSRQGTVWDSHPLKNHQGSPLQSFSVTNTLLLVGSRASTTKEVVNS